MEQTNKKKRPFYKRPAFLILLAIIIFGIIGSLVPDKNGGGNSNETTPIEESETVNESTVSAEAPITWQYSEYEDEMTGGINKYAEITAENKEVFDFPYNVEGGSTFTFTFRRRGKKLDAYLKVDKGQFITSFSGTEYRIKFDDEAPIPFSVNPPSDNSSNFVFIGSTKKLLKKVQNAKKMIIEGQFFQEGNRNIKFNVEGLKFE